MITIACVRIGKKYPSEYVAKLFSMLRRYLPKQLEMVNGENAFTIKSAEQFLKKYRFVCLTDQPEQFPGVENIPVWHLMEKYNLKKEHGWWAKIFLFNRSLVGTEQLLYFDLDTVIINSLGPLLKAIWKRQFFAICENFTMLAGHSTWPCRYGSCLMYLPKNFGQSVFNSFIRNPANAIRENPKGDQQFIERQIPNAIYFQDICPPGYIVGRRDFTDQRPKEAAIMIFAGPHKPHNTKIGWLRNEWR